MKLKIYSKLPTSNWAKSYKVFLRPIAFILGLTSLSLCSFAYATPITIDFSFKDVTNTSIANGYFTYDNSKFGTIIDTSNLSDFQLTTFAPDSYDLAFMNSSSLTLLHFAYDTSANLFIAQSFGGLDVLMAAVTGGTDGFAIARSNSATPYLVADYPGPVTRQLGAGTDSIQISTRTNSTVPEAPTFALISIGLIGIHLSKRLRHEIKLSV